MLIAVLVAAGLTVGGLYAFGAFSTEIRLEPVAAVGPDPFTTPVGQGVTSAPPLPSAPPPLVTGSQVGLYGGTGNNAVCDANQLVTFLQQNPDKAAAWAAVEGITPDQIPAYVATLTPLVLRVDTAVTNHGFKNGRANPINSVLQAGTAVLVDDRGVPRARCFCGNPLVEPKRFSKPSYTGDRWPSFNAERIIVVQPSPRPITIFQTINITTGQPYPRTAGAKITGGPGTGTTGPAPSTTPTPAPSPVPTSTPTTTTPPPGQPRLPVIHNRSYSVPAATPTCQGFGASYDCQGSNPQSPFQLSFICTSDTTCTDQRGRTWTGNGNEWSTSYPSTKPFTCDGKPSPTTNTLRFTANPSGSIRGTITQRAAPTGTCGELALTRPIEAS